MKKFLLVLALFSGLAFAEASFDQIETLIQQKNYQAAEQGLEVIIKNHPQSAKAFYAMAQAQAGLGNLEKAQKALNIATGLNPTLDFAPASSVASLKEAITPQTKKIEAVEESHFWVNFAYFALFCGFAVACYFLYSVYARKQEQEQAEKADKEAQWAKEMDEAQARHDAFKAAREAEKQEPVVPQKKKTKAQLQAEADALALREATARAEAAEAEARRSRTYSYSSPQPTTTVVNNSGNDMLTGVLIGNMLSSHHDTTRVVEREVVREVPAPSRSSSWDDTPTPSRSSSWDDDSSSKSSSSWSSSSDSSSSSSWDSSSSSSDSSSSW